MASRARTVGVRELRQNLSVYLARVKKGQALTVTEHGRAVAELRPLSQADALQQLVAEGRVIAPRRGPGALPKPVRAKLDRPVSALLQDLRDDAI